MILVRSIFQAKFGTAGELSKVFKEGMPALAAAYGGKARVLTDLSGQYDTVVMEIEVESLAVWEQSRHEIFSRPEFRQSFERAGAMIQGGRSEFYTIE